MESVVLRHQTRSYSNEHLNAHPTAQIPLCSRSCSCKPSICCRISSIASPRTSRSACRADIAKSSLQPAASTRPAPIRLIGESSPRPDPGHRHQSGEYSGRLTQQLRYIRGVRLKRRGVSVALCGVSIVDGACGVRSSVARGNRCRSRAAEMVGSARRRRRLMCRQR
jgi:hypothetical protein